MKENKRSSFLYSNLPLGKVTALHKFVISFFIPQRGWQWEWPVGGGGGEGHSLLSIVSTEAVANHHLLQLLKRTCAESVHHVQYLH